MKKLFYAFLDNVFNKFGILNEVLIDQGTKFHGKFQELWDRTLINHCTSQDHFLSRQINWTNGVNGETKFVKVWVSKKPY